MRRRDFIPRLAAMAGIRTYDEIPEHTFSPRDPSHRVYGRSIYRGLARQLLGDPGNFNDIIGEVLHHFLRVFFNPQHPLHGQYRLFDGKNFYYNLSRPDLSDSRDTLLKALKIISNALRIEIILHENDSKKYLNTKIGSTFENHAQCRLFIRRREMHYVAFSMIPEDSGQDIINYMRLQNTIGEGWILNIKRIKWWWNPESDSTNFECANEFVSVSSRVCQLLIPTHGSIRKPILILRHRSEPLYQTHRGNAAIQQYSQTLSSASKLL